MVKETNTLMPQRGVPAFSAGVRRSFRACVQRYALVIMLPVCLSGCAQDPNGGWRSLFPRAPSAVPPAPEGAAAPSVSSSPTRGRFGSLFGDLRRRADAQSKLAQEQERRLRDLSDLEREIEKERLLFKQKRDELERQNVERIAAAERSSQQNNAQIDQFRERSMSLDNDNRDLQGMLASSQQQIRRMESEMEMMRTQINDAARQLSDTDRARALSDQRVQSLQASADQRRVGRFVANSSLKRTLTAVQVPGMDIRQDNDLVRITIPSDKIFLPGTATLHQGAATYFDQTAGVLSKHYPNQIVGVESHFDNSSLAQTEWRSAHQLTSAQAMAVFEQLSYRHGMNSRQLFVLGHGANHPLASNETELGRSRNRRVEVVVYPERPQ